MTTLFNTPLIKNNVPDCAAVKVADAAEAVLKVLSTACLAVIVLEVEIAPADEISRLVVTTPVDAATVICSKPPSDLTGPEKVEFAIISSSEISSIVSACLLGQSIEQVKYPRFLNSTIRRLLKQ